MEHTANDSLHNYGVEGMDNFSRIQHRLGMWSTDCLVRQVLDSPIRRILDTVRFFVEKYNKTEH